MEVVLLGEPTTDRNHDLGVTGDGDEMDGYRRGSDGTTFGQRLHLHLWLEGAASRDRGGPT